MKFASKLIHGGQVHLCHTHCIHVALASQYSVSCITLWLPKIIMTAVMTMSVISMHVMCYAMSKMTSPSIARSVGMLPTLAVHVFPSLYILLNHVLEPSDLDLWPMTLIFRVDPGIIKMHPCAKFHDPGFIGLGFRGLTPFGVRALEKK